MNTAKTLVYDTSFTASSGSDVPVISADVPVVEVLPRLLDSPSHTLSVTDGASTLGLITERLLLEGLAREFTGRGDCAVLTLSCAVSDYSASRIAMAVEDTGFHLLDLWTSPSDQPGRMQVTLRLQCADPSATVRALERYGYEVEQVYSRDYADADTASQRLLALQAYLNV